MKKLKPICVICGLKFHGYGNNALPVKQGRCCDTCNAIHVIPTRMLMLREERLKVNEGPEDDLEPGAHPF